MTNFRSSPSHVSMPMYTTASRRDEGARSLRAWSSLKCLGGRRARAINVDTRERERERTLAGEGATLVEEGRGGWGISTVIWWQGRLCRSSGRSCCSRRRRATPPCSATRGGSASRGWSTAPSTPSERRESSPSGAAMAPASAATTPPSGAAMAPASSATTPPSPSTSPSRICTGKCGKGGEGSVDGCWTSVTAANLLAGAAAGCTTLAIIYPLDIAHTRIAVDIGRTDTRQLKGICHFLHGP
ncbi:hypothetical protein COCNU_06G001820 [Cocos nucifera]|uniref:Uncharacterized protein n=1 Tax=Cocos nucifera TaxID=13894 RepID=A0A8K0I9S7_COCNU|nr:hypothetical protein COCNU_06G001820 [Cocos nucifera]